MKSKQVQLVAMKAQDPPKGKKRIAAYCRVSSLSQEQMHSLVTAGTVLIDTMRQKMCR